MICDDAEAPQVVQILHKALFGDKAGEELK